MRITYQITKKRGNWRPVLTYQCVMEDWEKSLSVEGGKSGVKIEYVRRYEDYCLPGGYERGNDCKHDDFHVLKYPETGNSEREETVRLPWKTGKSPDFPEIKEAFRLFMAEWERRVMEALDSGPVEHTGNVEHTSEFKKRIAPFVAAKKMLNTE